MKPWLKSLALLLVGGLIGSAITAGGIHFSFYSFKKMRTNISNSDFLLERFSRNLQLNDVQRTQVAALLKENLPKMEAVRTEAEAKRKAAWDAYEGNLRKLLSEAQQKKLDVMETQWRGHMDRGPGFGGFHGGPPVTLMTPSMGK
jgi:hypothetical protein